MQLFQSTKRDMIYKSVCFIFYYDAAASQLPNLTLAYVSVRAD